jgi:hypothetical protein
MSFQDFSSSRPRNASSAASSNNNSPSRPSSASSGFGSSISSSGGASGSNPLAQVSEALLQYQVRRQDRTDGGAHTSFPLSVVAFSHQRPRYRRRGAAQRNVGILENIVASMTTSSNNRSNGGELQAQYRAQVDVLDLLGRKVRSLLDNSLASATPAATATARTKLARDFDRVQAQAHNLQERVSRFQKATAATSASSAAGGSASSSSQRNNNATSADDYYQQVQLQLHQDVRCC